MSARVVNTLVNATAVTLLVLMASSSVSVACGGNGHSPTSTSTARASPAAERTTSKTPDPRESPQSGSSGGTLGPGASETSGRPPNTSVPAPGFPTMTPLPPSGLTLELLVPANVSVGQTVQTQVRIRGTASASIGAFNFDLVYNEAQVRLQAPVPSEAVLAGTERDFSCDLPPPSADVEPATSVGRARLACFSFGDEGQRGLSPPAVLATIAMRPLVPGTIQLEWDAVALFAWDGANLGTITQAPPSVSTVEGRP